MRRKLDTQVRFDKATLISKFTKVMKNNSLGDRIIIIGGAPRSGTTLLQNMLDSHPDIIGGPEFLHLPDIVLLQKKIHASIDKEWIDLFCSKEASNRYIGKLIESFLLPLLGRYDGRFLCEKTPGNILVFSELLHILPHAKFIFVIRDPRATIASMLEVGEKSRKKGIPPAEFTKNLDSASRYVYKCIGAGFSAADENKGRVLIVRYEDLVTAPKKESNKICGFLGIDWDQAMSMPSRVKHLGEKAITVKSNEIWYDKNMYNSDPHTKSIDKWKNLLSASQQISIQDTFGNNDRLKNLGYKINTDHLPSGKKMMGMVCHLFNEMSKKLLSNRVSRLIYKKLRL